MQLYRSLRKLFQTDGDKKLKMKQQHQKLIRLRSNTRIITGSGKLLRQNHCDAKTSTEQHTSENQNPCASIDNIQIGTDLPPKNSLNNSGDRSLQFTITEQKRTLDVRYKCLHFAQPTAIKLWEVRGVTRALIARDAEIIQKHMVTECFLASRRKTNRS